MAEENVMPVHINLITWCFFSSFWLQHLQLQIFYTGMFASMRFKSVDTSVCAAITDIIYTFLRSKCFNCIYSLNKDMECQWIREHNSALEHGKCALKTDKCTQAEKLSTLYCWRFQINMTVACDAELVHWGKEHSSSLPLWNIRQFGDIYIWNNSKIA